MNISDVLKTVKKHNMIKKGDRIVCGLSAGPDSVCLFYCLNELKDELGIELAAVHVNHGIRGEEAKRDELFAKEMAERAGAPFKAYYYDIPEMASRLGITEEEAGRNARAEAFRDFMENEGYDRLALAHNANDCAETVLMNLSRGTGLTGIGGIKPVRDHIIRPLIYITRDEIEEFLSLNSIGYMTDSTNNGDEYTRNRIRHNVLPYLCENVNSASIEHISEAAGAVRDAVSILESITDEDSARYLESVEGGILIKEGAFRDIPRVRTEYVIRRALYGMTPALKDIGREHIEITMSLFGMASGKRADLPYGITAERTYGGVILLKPQDDTADEEGTELIPGSRVRAFGMSITGAYVSDVPSPVPDMTYTKWFDCDRIKGRLCIRNRRAGDRIVIDKEGNTKKLSDFMTDERIPRYMRDSVALIADDEYVLWVIGFRMGENVKIGKDTEKVLRIEVRTQK